jgi:hypothetical protein
VTIASFSGAGREAGNRKKRPGSEGTNVRDVQKWRSSHGQGHTALDGNGINLPKAKKTRTGGGRETLQPSRKHISKWKADGPSDADSRPSHKAAVRLMGTGKQKQKGRGLRRTGGSAVDGASLAGRQPQKNVHLSGAQSAAKQPLRTRAEGGRKRRKSRGKASS